MKILHLLVFGAAVLISTPAESKEVRLKERCTANRCVYYDVFGQRKFSIRRDGDSIIIKTPVWKRNKTHAKTRPEKPSQ